uniref:Uncharacterized protein n=1 Tax=Ditylenchus dipsaci TaxID=166011 RepID=A0A915E5N3_9BILA
MQEKHDVCIENCNLYIRRGFTVVALSSNNSIGRYVCFVKAIRSSCRAQMIIDVVLTIFFLYQEVSSLCSSILAIDYLFSNKMVLGTDSSEILVVEYKESQLNSDVDEPSIEVIKSIRLSSDERIICLQLSKRNDLVAVECLMLYVYLICETRSNDLVFGFRG